jgi:hypothetical protein
MFVQCFMKILRVFQNYYSGKTQESNETISLFLLQNKENILRNKVTDCHQCKTEYETLTKRDGHHRYCGYER